MDEAGVKGYEFSTWYGLLVPAGTPQAIVDRLNAEINKAVVSPAAKERLGAVGYELVGGTVEQFTALVNREITKWADVVKRTGAKVD